MKKLIFMCLLLSVLHRAQAQIYVESQFVHHLQSVNFNTGTQGFGAEYRYSVADNVNLRAGFNILPVQANNVFQLSGLHSTSNVQARFTNVHILADYTPFEGFSFLRLVGGAAYFTQGKGHMAIQPTDTYKYGDITLDKEQVGTLDMDINWQGVAPYFGLGLFHAFPRRTFNVNVDLGTYYLTQPKAQIVGTGILAGNSSQSATFQKNITNYRWYPQLQLNFNFNL